MVYCTWSLNLYYCSAVVCDADLERVGVSVHVVDFSHNLTQETVRGAQTRVDHVISKPLHCAVLGRVL